MKALYFFLLVSLLCFACAEQQDPLLQEIGQLEQKMEKWPSTEIASELIERYGAYAEAHAEEAEKAAEALLNKAKYQLYLKRPAAASRSLKEGLVKYPRAKSAYEMAVLLAGIWQQNADMESAARAVYASLPEAFPDREEARRMKDSLAANLGAVPAYLDSLKLSLYNSQVRIDRAAAMHFVNMAEAYALMMPQSEQAPEYLFDAAKVAGYLGNFSRSIDLYRAVYQRYPEYEKAHQALFMLGFIYDSDLKDFDKAKYYYNLYLEKYPEGAFAEQIQMLIQHLGKSDEELLEELTKKQNVQQK